MKNEFILKCLFKTKSINLEEGTILAYNPPGKSGDFDFDKIEGMLLGLAIGDALGATTEGMPPAQRWEAVGEVTSYLPHPYARGREVGLPTDDTQLAFWTLEHLLQYGALNPEGLAETFCGRRIIGIGATVRDFVSNHKRGVPWYKCGPPSAGNGALMRIAPVLIPHLKGGGRELWIDTVLAAMLTHNDQASISACTAFIGMLWDLLDMDRAPDPLWWINRYIEIAGSIEGRSSYSPRGGEKKTYCGPLWRYVQEKVPAAYFDRLSVLQACNNWLSGAYLLETVPSALYILMLHADDTEEAILRAVNDTLDNDTIAAIVGAAVGALHGKGALPAQWLEGLAGYTTMQDEGRVFDLIGQAKDVFWERDGNRPT